MKIHLLLLLPALLLTSVASLAAEKTITLSVPDMISQPSSSQETVHE